MISTPLFQIILDSVLFFGLSNDDVVQPDAAVSQLEAISSILRELPGSDKRDFLAFVERAANSEEAEGGTRERIEFMRKLSESLGLA